MKRSMIREIVEVDEALCDGCGVCVPSCAEGALKVVDGKLRLSADALCDGLGACLGTCPQGALRVIRREAAAFDEAAVHAALAAAEAPPAPPPAELRLAPRQVPGAHEPAHGCPGSRPRTFEAPEPRQPVAAAGGRSAPVGPGPSRPRLSVVSEAAPPPLTAVGGSRLRQWPVQLSLVSPSAPDLKGADLLLAADCVPFAYARFHDDMLEGRRLLVGCPKLDDLSAYAEKLAEIFRRAEPRSVRVARMEVPCCAGLVAAARQALTVSGAQASFDVVTVGINGALMA